MDSVDASLRVQDINADDVLDRSRVVALPMRVTFRGIRHREALLMEGPCGWAEWSPFLEYSTAEAARWLRCTLEMAYVGPPQPLRESVAVNATIPAVEPHDVAGILARFPGVTTVKVKVAEKGQSLAEDVARVREVRRLMPDAKIRVDANQGWTVEQAIEAAQRLGEVDYMEQPCATVEEMEKVRPFARVAADESIRRSDNPCAVRGRVDAAILKCQPMGGPRRVLALEKTLGLPVTVSSALETAVGMFAGVATAAALDNHQAAGLGTSQFFLDDVAECPPIVNGKIAVAPVIPTHFPRCGNTDFWHKRLIAALSYLQSTL